MINGDELGELSQWPGADLGGGGEGPAYASSSLNLSCQTYK